MDMLSIIGIVLAIISIAFAFETPRHWVLSKFKKTSPITHDFKIYTSFHSHNEGQPLGPLGTNKTEKSYILNWVVTNNTNKPIQIDRCFIMRQRSNSTTMSLIIPELTEETTIHSGHKLEVMSLVLTPGEVNHYRHWAKESSAFGIRESSGAEHWVNENKFQKFSNDLESIAKEFGLPSEVPKGTPVVLKINKTTNN